MKAPDEFPGLFLFCQIKLIRSDFLIVSVIKALFRLHHL
jgi:hypothetical protein